MSSQEKNILIHLLSKRSITPLEALVAYGCFRLSARIYDLRAKGYTIKMEMVEINGKRVARYSM